MYKDIAVCRVCGNSCLEPVLQLGQFALTGFFPETRQTPVDIAPLELVKCSHNGKHPCCGLLQLRSSYQFKRDYYLHYGYRSGLNRMMVQHLRCLAAKVCERASLKAGDYVVDIGSNDATFLKAFGRKGLNLVGIDPSAESLQAFYSSQDRFIGDFFSARCYEQRIGVKAKVVASIAMFYNLEAPLEFARQVYSILEDDGLWVFEQSYMPAMLDRCAYDTICHEHLMYYGLSQIKWIVDRAGFKIVDVVFNDANGGSFCVMAAKVSSRRYRSFAGLTKLLGREKALGLDEVAPYKKFSQDVFQHRSLLRALIQRERKKGKRLIGWGASTKGNVVLQFCGLTDKDLDCIAEVNEDKFGSFTPGSLIPICSEQEAKKRKPDYLFVLPWHFKKEFLMREKEYMKKGGALLFALPNIEVIKSDGSQDKSMRVF
ncbi:MAG: methyltransferase domain-containing protein [Candidatus Omnitrophota bacterium]